MTTKEFITFKYPCLDKYPPGREYVSKSRLRSMAQEKLKAQGLRGKLSVAGEFRKLRAAFKVSSIWKQDTINIAFLDGTPKQQNWTREVIQKHLEPLCDKITFNWNTPIAQSHIRVSFNPRGQAWSYIGTDALSISQFEPTMNLGWLDDDVQYGDPKTKNTGQVVMHEFGHAMGMVHEHQNPKNNPIIWNKAVVSDELRRTQGWDQSMIENNMFVKYGDYERCKEMQSLPAEDPSRRQGIVDYCSGTIVNGSRYDVNSVMHYFYPQEWILAGPKKIPLNTEYSELDKKWLRQYYGTPVSTETTSTQETSEKETTTTQETTEKETTTKETSEKETTEKDKKEKEGSEGRTWAFYFYIALVLFVLGLGVYFIAI